MAEPRETRVTPAPTTSYADDRRAPSSSSAASDASFAEWYASRFGTPMPTPQPTSYADERRAPTPTPTYTPQAPASPAAMYQARWGTPRPLVSADERRQPSLVEVLKGMRGTSPDRLDPARTRGEERRKKPLPPETFSDNFRKGPNSPSGDERRQPAPPPHQTGDERRTAAAVAPPTTGDERRFPPRRFSDERRTRVAQSSEERREPARRYSDDRRTTTAPQRYGDERRQPGALPGVAEILGPAVPPETLPKMGKGMKLENIPAPPSRLSGRRRGEGDVAKRTAPTAASTYDPKVLQAARAVLAEAQKREDEGSVDFNGFTTEGGVTTPNIDFNSVPDWIRTGDLLPGINIDVERGTMENYIPGVKFTKGDTSEKDDGEMSVEEAQKIVDQATRAKRKHAIGADRGTGNVPISKQVDRMTWEEYNALDPKQRAAVDFNAGLVTSVRRDRKTDYEKPDEDAKKAYDDLVTKIFGKGGGSKTYAPATVALLESIGFTDKNADLDDFLNLSAAIHEGDLGRLGQEGIIAPEAAQPALEMFGIPTAEKGKNLTEAGREKAILAQDLALRNASNVDDVMQRGNAVLQTYAQSAAVDRNELVTKIGGEAVAPAAMTGYGTPASETGELTLDGYIQKTYNSLANAANNPEDVMAVLQGDIDKGIMTPEKMKALYDFIEHRTRQSVQYGMPVGEQAGVKYRDPNVLRVFLNMEKVNSGG